jgi:predicted lipoprotein
MRQSYLLLLSLAIALGGCKFVPTASKNAAGSSNGAAQPDPESQVAAMWDTKIIPYLERRAGNFADVEALARTSPEEAGSKYGHKEKEGSSPWTVVVRLEGKIVAANTESRAGSIDVDADADGKADARVQIGPVMRGTALRDSLDFVSFNQFTNQIDFAQFGKAFNLYVDKTLTSKLPRTGLVGRGVRILGAYPLGGADGFPLLAPAEIALEPPP